MTPFSAAAVNDAKLNPLADDLDDILTRTQSHWEQLRNQRIFITGGTGFFGCWLLESFIWANQHLNLNAQAVVLTRNPQAFHAKAPRLATHPSISFHQGDLCSFTFPAGDFSHIMHAATEVTGTQAQRDPLGLFDSIVTGTRHTLELARQKKVQKFLLTSSGGVYSRQATELAAISEDYPGGPDVTLARSAYGEGKRAAEHLCALYHHQHGLDVKIARCFALIGPYLPLNDGSLAICNFIRDALQGGPIHINGDGTPFRSYMYASDLMVWLWTMLFTGQAPRAYNVGSPVPISIADLAKTIAQVIEPMISTPGNLRKIPVNIALPPTPGKAPERYIPSTTRAETELQLVNKVPLGDAIAKTARWAKLHGYGASA